MNIWKTYLLVFLLAFGGSAIAQQPGYQSLPVLLPEDSWCPLSLAADETLQSKLEERLSGNERWASLIRKEKMAVGLVDLTDLDSPRFACVNGNTMMYAASLPKIAVLLAAFQTFEDGALEETPEIMNELTRMIRYSSNTCATRVIDRLGFEKIEEVLRDPQHQLFDANRGGGLWVGKRYGKSGKRYPDPIKGLSHAATVNQVCRFYYLLATGKLINPQRSQQMLEILSNPKINHKFVSSLEKKLSKSCIFRKSGTWRNWHADSVLVWGPEWRRYILVGLVEDPQGEQSLRNLVPAIEEILRD